jgi:hypothetical protein
LSETDLDRIEKTCIELFVEAEEQEHVNLEDDIDSNDVFNSVILENTEQEKKLPNDFNVFDFLENLKDKTKLSSEEGSLKNNINTTPHKTTN